LHRYEYQMMTKTTHGTCHIYMKFVAFQNTEFALGKLWHDFRHLDYVGQQGPLRSKWRHGQSLQSDIIICNTN
jgi:hypothetical protein